MVLSKHLKRWLSHENNLHVLRTNSLCFLLPPLVPSPPQALEELLHKLAGSLQSSHESSFAEVMRQQAETAHRIRELLASSGITNESSVHVLGLMVSHLEKVSCPKGGVEGRRAGCSSLCVVVFFLSDEGVNCAESAFPCVCFHVGHQGWCLCLWPSRFVPRAKRRSRCLLRSTRPLQIFESRGIQQALAETEGRIKAMRSRVEQCASGLEAGLSSAGRRYIVFSCQRNTRKGSRGLKLCGVSTQC